MASLNFILRIFATVFVIIALITSINPVSGSTNDDSYFSGSLIASYNNFVYGNIIYRSIVSNNISVTTLETDFGGVAPFHPYFSQSLSLNDSTFFLSNGIAGFEIFNDTNHNGFIDSIHEIAYWVLLNATQGFYYSNISKEVTGSTTVYTWSSHYYNIDGFPIVNPNYTGQIPAISPMNMRKILIPSFNITYSLVDANKYADLSITYDIGPWDAYIFGFDNSFNEVRNGTINLSGFGLSIVYTSVIRSNDLVKKVDNTNNGTTSNITFEYNSYPIFESKFDDTYSIVGNSTKLPVKTVVADNNTLIQDQNLNWGLTHDYLDEIKEWNSSITSLPAIPGNNVPIQQLFNYRVCYPQWSGQAINHDPTFRTNKSSSNLTNTITTKTSQSISLSNPLSFEFPSVSGLSLIVLSSGAGIVVIAIVAIIEKRK